MQMEGRLFPTVTFPQIICTLETVIPRSFNLFEIYMSCWAVFYTESTWSKCEILPLKYMLCFFPAESLYHNQSLVDSDRSQHKTLESSIQWLHFDNRVYSLSLRFLSFTCYFSQCVSSTMLPVLFSLKQWGIGVMTRTQNHLQTLIQF